MYFLIVTGSKRHLPLHEQSDIILLVRKNRGSNMSEYKYRIVKGKRIPEHRAVIEEALQIILGEDLIVHHINGDKKDNRRENLQVMDKAEHNRMHASQMPQLPEKQRKVSKARKGKSNPDARALSAEQVKAVVTALRDGAAVSALAEEYHVSDHVIRNIRDGKTYQDILAGLPPELFPLPGVKKRAPSANRKLGITTVTTIRILLLSGQSVSSLAKNYGVSQETIRKIRDREIYQDVPWPERIAEYRDIRDMKELADIMLDGPLPEQDDGLFFERDDIRILTGEQIDGILMEQYGLFPNALARAAYVMMRRALAGDRPLLFTLFALSSYEDLVPQLIRRYSQLMLMGS